MSMNQSIKTMINRAELNQLTQILAKFLQSDLNDKKIQIEVLDALKNQPKLAIVANDLGVTLLHAAARAGNLTLCKALIEHRAPIKARDKAARFTPIDYAIKQQHNEIVEYLSLPHALTIIHEHFHDVKENSEATKIHPTLNHGTSTNDVSLIDLLVDTCSDSLSNLKNRMPSALNVKTINLELLTTTVKQIQAQILSHFSAEKSRVSSITASAISGDSTISTVAPSTTNKMLSSTVGLNKESEAIELKDMNEECHYVLVETPQDNNHDSSAQDIARLAHESSLSTQALNTANNVAGTLMTTTTDVIGPAILHALKRLKESATPVISDISSQVSASKFRVAKSDS